MRQFLLLTLLFGVFLLGSFATGQTTQSQQTQESYNALSEKFFDLLGQGKSNDAVDFLFETNPALEKMTDDAQQLKTQFGSLGPLMGSYISHTKLVETKVAGMLVYQHFFVAYQRQPISVRIKYYKPGTKWLCYGLQFDAKIDSQIQSMADEKILTGSDSK